MYDCSIPGGKSITIKCDIRDRKIQTKIPLKMLKTLFFLAILFKKIITKKPMDTKKPINIDKNNGEINQNIVNHWFLISLFPFTKFSASWNTFAPVLPKYIWTPIIKQNVIIKIPTLIGKIFPKYCKWSVTKIV